MGGTGKEARGDDVSVFSYWEGLFGGICGGKRQPIKCCLFEREQTYWSEEAAL